MSDYADRTDSGSAQPRRRITGWMVFGMLLAFFGIIFAVNGTMIYEALSTLSGVDTASAYQAGRMYEREVALAKAQNARHWRVAAQVTRQPDGTERVRIVADDEAGAPLHDLTAAAAFERPTNQRLDRTVAVAEAAPGRFHGSATLAAGQWDLVIELSRQSERLFRSRNRIVLK